MSILFGKIPFGVPFVEEHESGKKPREIYRRELDIDPLGRSLDNEKVSIVAVYCRSESAWTRVPTTERKFKGRRFRLIKKKVLNDFKNARKKLMTRAA